jgi:hypothetical protein
MNNLSWQRKSHTDGNTGIWLEVSVSILVVFGWAIFFALWLFFYAGGFDLVQNIGVFILSIIIGVAILAAAWAPWESNMARSGKETKSLANAETRMCGTDAGAQYTDLAF